MAHKIQVAHDFICPWCWVGVIQAKRLALEFDIEFDWRGYELFPEELEWPEAGPQVPPPANKPATPTRFEFLLLADDLEMPKAERPRGMRTHNAHEAVEYAKSVGRGEDVLEALYRAYWHSGANINDPETLVSIAGPIVGETGPLLACIQEKKFKSNIVGFDDDAYSRGVYNVPTFFIGSERYAEQPLSVLRKAIKEFLDAH